MKHGDYGGIVPDYFAYGALDRYFLGEPEGTYFGDRIYVLACECGEAGCSPLAARVAASEVEVVWSDFVNPQLDIDYAALGELRFEREPYELALRTLAPLSRALTRR